MKKFLTVVSALILGLVLVACGDKAKDGLKVGLIGSAASLHDKGYNQFAVEGLKQAEKDFDISINTVDISNPSQIAESLDRFGKQKYDLVFTLEYDFNALITSHAGHDPIAKKYPDTIFVVFNDLANTNEQGVKIHENVIEVIFDVNESSFLAGALSVLVNENKDVLFEGKGYNFSDKKALAFMGATESNGITVFSYGYIEGANYAAKQQDVKYDMYETYQTGFSASQENANVAKSFYDVGVNIIFGVAGPVAGNIRSEAETAKRLMVDVDANQDNEKPGHVLTSVLKKTNVVVYDIIEDLVNGTLKGGVAKNYNLSSESTSITDLTVIESFMSDSAAAVAKWAEIKAELVDITAKINDKTIKVTDAQSGEKINKDKLTNLVFKSK